MSDKRWMKRGELTTSQLVMLIILITSFIIILFLLFRLNLGEQTNQEICRNSVIARGSPVLPTETIPLNCKRSYVCVTEDDSCESLTDPIKEKVETQEEAYGVLANEMANCWWMFGEGKVNYVGEDFTENLYCSICSQIGFDDSIKEIFPEGKVEKEALYKYMQENKVSGREETYLDYLYGTNNLQEIKEELDAQSLGFGLIDTNKQYYAMMGITSDVSKLKWATAAAGAALAIAFTPLVGAHWGLTIGIAVISGTGGAGAGTVGAFVVEGLSGNEYLAPSVIEVNSQEFKDLDCKSITTLS